MCGSKSLLNASELSTGSSVGFTKKGYGVFLLFFVLLFLYQMIDGNGREMVVHLEQRTDEGGAHIDKGQRVVGIARVAAHVANDREAALGLHHGGRQEGRDLAHQQDAVHHNVVLQQFGKRAALLRLGQVPLRHVAAQAVQHVYRTTAAPFCLWR